MLRLFFALLPAPDENAELARSSAALVEQLQGQRVPAENFHITLCFVGAVPPGELDRLREVAARVRGEQSTLRIDALDYWSEPRILCATAEDSTTNPARDLGQALGTAAVAAGFSPDIKPFRPHVTVARKVAAARALQLEWPQRLARPLVLRSERFVLMESQKIESGSIYSVVDSWPLDKKRLL